MVSKVIIHCGSSKNGSTSLQTFLLNNFSQLIRCGVFPLTSSYNLNVNVTTGNVFYDVNHIKIHADRSYHQKEIKNITTSFGIPYEAYKQFIFEHDTKSLKSLLSKIGAAIDRASSEIDIHTIVISAEAFETSLCLKDPIFKRALKALSKKYEIEIVYYAPNPVRYVISSWLEWGWIECFEYADWAAAFSVATNRSEFYYRRAAGVRYLSNLLKTSLWFGYWHEDFNLKYSFVENQRDIVDHFFSSILNIDYVRPEFDRFQSDKERNISWPKSLITIFPLCYGFFCEDYVKFDSVRQLLLAKDAHFECDLSNYEKIYILTSDILGWMFSEGFDATNGSHDQIDFAFAQLREIFEKVDKKVAGRAFTHLCETFYYYHVNQFNT